MPEKIIPYMAQPAKVNCDGNCKKAWGGHQRPKVYLSDDINDYAYLADNELGDAPDDPGTYEGFQAKPASVDEFPNKWCVRECERCAKSMPGRHEFPLTIKTFSERVYNIKR